MGPKPGLYYIGRYLYHVKGVKDGTIDLDSYLLVPDESRTEKKSEKMTTGVWANTMPMKMAVELDPDGMQGFILGIFGEEL